MMFKRFINVLNLLLISSLLIFYRCTSEDNPVKPQMVLPDIIWIHSGLDTCRVYSIYFPNSEIIFAGTNKGLYRSSDNGTSWIHIDIDSSMNPVNILAGHPDGSVLMVCGLKGIFKSSNFGQTWQYIGLRDIAITSITADTEGNIFAGTRGSGIYTSVSPFEEWYSVGPNSSNGFFSSLLINSTGIMFAGSSGVYRSNNSGKTWQLKNNGMGNWQVYSLIEGKAGEIFAGADVGGFFRSTDKGDSWIRSNKGLVNTEVLSLAISETGNLFTGTLKGGVYQSADNGDEWISADSGLTNKSVYSLAVSPGDFLFAGTFRD